MMYSGLIRTGMMLAFTILSASGAGQREVNLQILATDSGAAEIRWSSRSAVPLPGMQLFPEYQLEESEQLNVWAAVGTRMAGTTSGQSELIRVLIQTDGRSRSFYRVQSVIDRPFADFNQVNLASGELQRANFFGAQFFAANLGSANLEGANLSGTDLRFVNLNGANLDEANLFAADLVLARMQFASLERANLRFASLEGADMIGGSFFGADLRGTILTQAKLEFVTLHHSVIDAHTMFNRKWRRVWELVNGKASTNAFRNADFSLADLRSANLRSLNFSGCSFLGSDLGAADLRGANFDGADLRLVIFQQALLDTNTVIEARSRIVWEIVNTGGAERDLRGIDLSSTSMADVDLRNSNLVAVQLRNAILARANLSGANARGANFSSADLFGTILTNATLDLANFRAADLTGANLRGATTSGADFTGAVFNDTILPDGSLRRR